MKERKGEGREGEGEERCMDSDELLFGGEPPWIFDAAACQQPAASHAFETRRSGIKSVA